MKKLIIFDCDGVLVDSEKIANQVFVDCLADCQVSMSVAEAIRLFKGQKVSHCLSIIEGLTGSKLPSDFETNFRTKMMSRFETSLKPVEGVEAAIRALKDFNMCVASNGPIEKMQKTLSLVGLDKYFGKNIFSAYSIQKWKPEPDLFLHASSVFEVDPGNCLVIEDSALGIVAAQRAQMKVLGFVAADNEEELSATGAEVFVDMRGLPTLVAQAFSK